MFPGMVVDAVLVAHRSSSQQTFRSMCISTLLALLQKSYFIGKGVLPQLANILSGINCDPHHINQITVATTQVPVFDPDFTSPHYGYRLFGPLGQQAIEFLEPPPTFDFDQEVYTTPNQDHTQVVDFAMNWEMTGLLLDFHFNIIFFDTLTTLPIPLEHYISSAKPATHPSSILLVHNSSVVNMPTHSNSHSPSPTLPFGDDYSHQLNHDSDSSRMYSIPMVGLQTGTYHSHSPSPTLALGSDSGNYHSNSNSVSSPDPSMHTNYQIDASHSYSLTPSLTPLNLSSYHTYSNTASSQDSPVPSVAAGPCPGTSYSHSHFSPPTCPLVAHDTHGAHGVSHGQSHALKCSQANSLTLEDIHHICSDKLGNDVIQGAHHHTDKDVFTMALIHRNMACVLKELNLQFTIYGPYSLAKGAIVSQVTGGASTSANSVLATFGWNADYYKNESAWFKWAHDTVNLKQWKGPPPQGM